MRTEDQMRRLRAALQSAIGVRKRLGLAGARRIASETNLPLREVEHFALREAVVPERYERNVAALGLDGQAELLRAAVAVVGLGGLGGHVVESLARVGVGRIVGIDGDVLAESNLNRQLLATVGSLGRTKVREAARRVARINPAIEFTGHGGDFQELSDDIWRGCDLVFDCLDSIPARRVLSRRCESASVTLVHGAIAGWCGQVAICPAGDNVLERIYATAERGAEERTGNLPFTAAVAANLMVAKAVPLLLGERAETARSLVFFDLRAGDWEAIEL